MDLSGAQVADASGGGTKPRQRRTSAGQRPVCRGHCVAGTGGAADGKGVNAEAGGAQVNPLDPDVGKGLRGRDGDLAVTGIKEVEALEFGPFDRGIDFPGGAVEVRLGGLALTGAQVGLAGSLGGGRASDDAIRSWVISYKLLGTTEWFVTHHTDCGMETFTDEIMRGLLHSSLDISHADENGWHDHGGTPGSAEGDYMD